MTRSPNNRALTQAAPLTRREGLPGDIGSGVGGDIGAGTAAYLDRTAAPRKKAVQRSAVLMISATPLIISI